ncbi:type I-C CRISPR-associated protein Cas8c/Csd1 [Nocardia salmonicida]|uniref:type I-C CRISPR-associated protein Cas8c/Csd1 n=1 Tax=Nocardia salmonicida TaxID=53431 RepID=UPI003CED6109
MLLTRLTAFADAHRGTVPAFHRDREFRFNLNIDTDASGAIVKAAILPLHNPDKPKRGVVHTVPASTRTVGVSPNLASDDAQYVLGRGDEKSKLDRVRQCHEAFVGLVGAWADSVEPSFDPVPHILRRFYRGDWAARIGEVEGLVAKDGVLVSIDGVPAHRSPSAATFWEAQVAVTKGSGRTGLCMVCAEVGALANTIPGKVASNLVPGASNDAALISINEPTFGYDLATQLTHTPICMGCADNITVGLTALLSSATHSISFPGQDTRLAWWTTDTADSDFLSILFDPDPGDVQKLLSSVYTGRSVARPSDVGRFCWLAVSGQVARIMVRDWVDMPLAAAGPDAVSHTGNIRAWFDDQEIVPRYPEPVTLADGRILPAGKKWQDVRRMAASLGRFDPTTNRYLPFVAKGGRPNPNRPNDALRRLLDAAVLNRPLPPALRAHLMHRIGSDCRVDDVRTSLVRLGLTRSPEIRRNHVSVPKGLDPTCTEPAYLAGRLFAVLESIQYKAHNPPRKNNSDDATGTADGVQPRRASVNSTFGDRYFRSAMMSPKPALLQGVRLSNAWVAKIRRRDGEQRANGCRSELSDLYAALQYPDGCPVRSNLYEQEWFVLGYFHQHHARKAQASK